MTRVQPITLEKADPEVKEIYTALKKQIGKVPNIFLNMGNSIATLKGFVGLNEAVALTSLPPKLREQLALVVGQTNQCNYCLSAHSASAHATGIPEQEIISARKGESNDPKTKAILSFAKIVVEKKGHVSDQEVANLKKAGVSDKEVVEIILVITINLFTNYFNHITDPDIDFPKASTLN